MDCLLVGADMKNDTACKHRVQHSLYPGWGGCVSEGEKWPLTMSGDVGTGPGNPALIKMAIGNSKRNHQLTGSILTRMTFIKEKTGRHDQQSSALIFLAEYPPKRYR